MHYDLEALKKEIVHANFAVEAAQRKLRDAELAYSNAIKLPDTVKLRHVAQREEQPILQTDC